MSKSKRPFVTNVRSNLKSPKQGGKSWSVDLGQYTLLVGSNTSHKSSVIQSVELALSGCVDDVRGRDNVKQSDMLLSLCAGDELFTSARLSNDDVGSYRVQRVDGTAKRPTHSGPGSQVLTHRAVKDALSGSAASQRKAFLSWIAGGVTKEELMQYLPDGTDMKLFNTLWDGKSLRKGSDVDTLIDIIEYADKRARSLSKEKGGAQAVIDGLLSQDLEPMPNDNDVVRIEQAVIDAEDLLQAAAACSTGMPESLRLQQMTECESELDRLSCRINDIVSEREGKIEPELCGVIPDYMKDARHVLEWALENDVEQCPTCSSPVGQEHLQNCFNFFDGQISSVMQEWQVKFDRLGALFAKEDDLKRQQEAVQKKLAELSNTPSNTGAGLSVEDARDRLHAARQALHNTMVLVSKWTQINESRELVNNLVDEAEQYKKLKTHCDQALIALMQHQRESFVGSVRKHLPGDWQFDIDLHDSRGRPTFRMGLERNGILHEALSGAEWATVTTAISMAVSDADEQKDMPTVLIPEDRAWDGKTLSSVMRSFRQFDGQVIMASTIRPTGRAPAGWTIIDMDKESASWTDGEPEEPTEVRKADVIRRPKQSNVVTTASAVAVTMMGFKEEDVNRMNRSTAAAIIKQNLSPDDITILDDGGYSLNKGGKVLNLPQPPGTQA